MALNFPLNLLSVILHIQHRNQGKCLHTWDQLKAYKEFLSYCNRTCICVHLVGHAHTSMYTHSKSWCRQNRKQAASKSASAHSQWFRCFTLTYKCIWDFKSKLITLIKLHTCANFEYSEVLTKGNCTYNNSWAPPSKLISSKAFYQKKLRDYRLKENFKDVQRGDQLWGVQVNPLHPYRVPMWALAALLPMQCPDDAASKTAADGPSMWETQLEFQASGFSLN